MQKSKSSVHVDIQEDSSGFKCFITLTIGTRLAESISTFGTAFSKKDARRNAMERLAALVIADDSLFWEGITGFNYVETLKEDFGDILATPRGQAMLKNAPELRQ